MSQSVDTTEPATAAGTVGAALSRWVRAVPPLLRILLVWAVAGVGLWASEHTLLYAPLGFPDEVGHSPISLVTQPG